MASKTAIQFVDSHPGRGSKRDQELRRAEARSHAAKVSHARRGIYTDGNGKDNAAVPDPQPLPDGNKSPTKSKDTLTAQTNPTSKAQQDHSVRPWQKFNQKDVPYNRFRAGAYQPARTVTKNVAQLQAIREGQDAPNKGGKMAHELVVRSFVPTFRGNSDPFNATVVRLSPIEHVLLQQARDQLILSVWPSEIAIRHNKDAIAHSSWKIVPPTLHDESANRALIAQSYYSHVTRQRAAGLPADKGLIQAEKYKFQALRGLQELLEMNRQSPGDRIRLRGMFLTCCWLAGSELLCHNFDAAEMHYIASKYPL